MGCAHKPKLLTCTKCAVRVCAACVQLERHGCTGLASVKEEERRKLAAQLVKVRGCATYTPRRRKADSSYQVVAKKVAPI
jgi:hypothetical protein